jgi:ketosteroid isomerase-like protein
MSHDRQVDVLREVIDAFNRHDLDAIMSHFAEDCVFEAPRGPDRWGRRFVGKAEVRRGLAARFEGIPNVHYGDHSHFACGTRGVSE